MKLEAIGIGNPVADILINIDKLPGADQSATLLEISYQFGGKVPTAMAALGRLGVPCGMVGVVGNDDEGRACIADFERHHVDASHMVLSDEISTRFSVVLSDRQGGRNFLRRNMPVRSVREDELDRAYIEQARVLHLSSGGPAANAAASWVRARGGRVCFDADGFKQEYEDMAPLIDAFIASETYYTMRYPGKSLLQCCEDIAARGPSDVIITLGARGCACLVDGRIETLSVYKVKVVDATGAGDTFHGAYIHGMLQGWDMLQSARFASAVSAIKCMAIGGRAGLPDLKTAEEFIKTGRVDTDEMERRKRLYEKPHGLQARA